MKQNITYDQLNALTLEERNILRDWWQPTRGDVYYFYNNGCTYVVDKSVLTPVDLELDINMRHNPKKCYPLMSIGQMIDFLELDNDNPFDGGFIDRSLDKSGKPWGWSVAYGSFFCWGELVDALWDAVLYKIRRDYEK